MEVFTPVLTFVWEQFGKGIDMVTERPFMLIPFGIGVAGSVLALAKGFFSFGRRRSR